MVVYWKTVVSLSDLVKQLLSITCLQQRVSKCLRKLGRAQETREGGASVVALPLKKNQLQNGNESRVLTQAKISSGQLGRCCMHSVRLTLLPTSVCNINLCAHNADIHSFPVSDYSLWSSRLIGYKINLIVKYMLTGRNKNMKWEHELSQEHIINLSFFLVASCTEFGSLRVRSHSSAVSAIWKSFPLSPHISSILSSYSKAQPTHLFTLISSTCLHFPPYCSVLY